MTENVSRRSFIKEALLTGAAAGLAGVAGVTSAYADEASAIEWESESDVVIVGGGTSGTTCALTAVQEGATVTVLEASPALGGNGTLCVGCILAAGTRLQKEAGIEDSGEQFFEEYLNSPYFNPDSQLRAGDEFQITEMVALESGEMIDWLMDCGVEITGPFSPENFKGGPVVDIVPRQHNFYPDSTVWPSVLQPQIEEAGGDIRFETKGVELIQEDGRVIGVKAIDQNTNEEIYFKANKGVVLATNGIEASPEYLMRGISYAKAQVTPSNPFNDGYGYRMAEAVGAVTTGWDNPVSITIRSQAPSLNIGSYDPLVGKGGIIVTSEGKRFASEDTATVDMALTLNGLPDQTGWIIFDDTVAAQYQEPEELSSMPGTGMGTMDDFVEQGSIKRADTIEEVAELAGLDPEAVAAEVAHYNEMVEAGEDADFGRKNNLNPIATPPYYIHGPQMPRYLAGSFSLHVTPDLEVTNSFGEPIPGLYAAGSNGAGNSPLLFLPGATHGGNVCRCLTTGRHLGKYLAAL